jgi:TolB protein
MKTERLTSDGKLKMDPVLFKNGEDVTLVYTHQETPALMCLMRMALPNGKPERLHPGATMNEFEPTFTPDGSFYAFVQTRGNLNLKLVIRDVKQNKEAIYNPGEGFAGMRHPSFAPDAGRVVFSIPASTGHAIAGVNRQGQDRKDITQVGFNSWPAFSPDGKQIAFGSSRDGEYEIYVMDADGSNIRRLTRSPGLDARPAWSPDGKRLAFTSNRDGNYQIYVMNADGTGVRRITRNTERDDFAAWHPDGKRLAFVGERSGKFDVYCVEVPAE